ncbi:hypothetical protein JCM10207_008545 [Rhodosporidiobolus poonsookiae]
MSTPAALSRRRPPTPLPTVAALPSAREKAPPATAPEEWPDSPSSSSSSSSAESAAEEGLLTPEVRRVQEQSTGRPQWVMRSRRKKKRGGSHLSPRTRNILIGVFVVVVIVAGGWAYYKWGSSAVEMWTDFVTFPEVDVTSAVMSVVSEVTSHIVGAESTLTSAVAQLTNVAKVTDVAQDAGNAITGAIGGIFG